MPRYDVAQVCLNGHLINSTHKRHPSYSQDFCEECGAKTITKCPSCNENIRGIDWDNLITGGVWPVPKYCIHCGESFPWTETRLATAAELKQLLQNFNDLDKDTIVNSLPDLVSETPRTQVVAHKVKRTLDTAGKTAYTIFRQVFVEVLSETAKKILFPGP